MGRKMQQVKDWRREVKDKEMKKGDVCLLDLAKWSCFAGHQVARVIDIIDENQVQVEWYHAPIGGKLSLYGSNRGEVQWLDKVPKSAIYYFGFNLTRGNYLPQEVKNIIEDYEDNY
jgi:hypothetical protein